MKLIKLLRVFVITGTALLTVVAPAKSAQLTVSHSAGPRYPAVGAWNSSGSLSGITRPAIEWRFAAGSAYDYNGGSPAGGYADHGLIPLTSPLMDVNTPSLGESPLAPDQSALDLDGVNDYLWVADSSLISLYPRSAEWTLVALFKTTGSASSRMISRGHGGSTQYALSLSASNVLQGIVGGATRTVGSGGQFTDGAWHVAAVVNRNDAGTYRYRAYCGGSVSSEAASGSDSLAAISFRVGARSSTTGNSGGAAFFAGSIAWVAIWPTAALTDANLDSIRVTLLPTGTAPRPFPSIQGARDMAATGDTLLVGTGRYQETISDSKGLRYWGSSSAFGERPELNGAALPAAAGVNGWILRGASKVRWFDVRGFSAGTAFYCDSTSDGARFDHVTVDSCKFGFEFHGTTDNDSVVNCTLDGASLAGGTALWAFSDSIAGGTATLVALNNIVVDWVQGWDVDTAHTTFTITSDYHDWSGVSSTEIALGLHSQQTSPLFRNQYANDYRPRSGQLSHCGLTWWAETTPTLGAWDLLKAGDEPSRTWARRPWGR